MPFSDYYPAFCLGDVQHAVGTSYSSPSTSSNSTIVQAVNRLLELSSNDDLTSFCAFILVENAEEGICHILDNALPDDGIFRSIVPDPELRGLGESLLPMKSKLIETGAVPSEIVKAMNSRRFGILDDRSTDQTMPFLKQDWDVPKESTGQVIRPDWGVAEKDVEDWHSVRIYFERALRSFASFQYNNLPEHKDAPGDQAYDEAGVFHLIDRRNGDVVAAMSR